MTVLQIISEVESYEDKTRAEWVCLTGGEPFIQDVSELVDRLNSYGYRTTIETNGTLYQECISRFDFVSISPKNTPEFSLQILKNLINHSTDCQLKFVHADKSSLSWMRDLVERLGFRGSVVIQPNGMIPPEDYLIALRFLWKAIQSPLWKSYDVRVIPQLHVMLFQHAKGI